MQHVVHATCCNDNMLHKQHNMFLIFCQRFALSFFREENPRHKKEKKMVESLLLCKTDSSGVALRMTWIVLSY